MSNVENIVLKVIEELESSTEKFPEWPKDPFHALMIVGEEAGEINQGLLEYIYEPEKGITKEDLENEAIQTAAMAIKFAMGIDFYDFKESEQMVLATKELSKLKNKIKSLKLVHEL